eukprot:714901_1
MRIFKDVESLRGGLNRQEAVSMNPPLLLDVRPHHRVRDMGAAHGLKAAQMVEDLNREENGGRSEGCVVPRPTAKYWKILIVIGILVTTVLVIIYLVKRWKSHA